ncbi:T9SS type A sorting domain-containing protein [uncultured Tenacibaculum sp.]|uniref:T9SS type A sorting domain-containing protein n=1 Tax=uncultured Tenacibaculum sp. TaxID=174713 RepID=UPI00262368AB|nr:T9SS type A sorting domain-containing protein [uncultured Tenacibaculum sp.]
MRNLLFIFLVACTSQLFSQNISFSFVNARNTNDGTDDFYEADIYIASDTDFIVGSGQIYFNYNTEAFGENVHANNNFEMSQPDGSILATGFFGGTVKAYQSFIVNDNTISRVSTSFQQLASSGTVGMPVVNSTPQYLYSIKIKYTDVSKSPNVSFETGGVFLDQFYTACGPTTAVAFGTADCTGEPGTQITGDSYDSTGAALVSDVNWTGASSAFWGVTSNWDNTAIPNTTNNVTIPDVTNDPILNTGSYVINDLIINSGADLTISNGVLNVNGDLTNSGAITVEADASNSSVFIVNGSATGEVTFQQNGLVANEWTVITAPVDGQSIKEFAEDVTNDVRINTTATPNRYAIAYYDDSNADGSKWVYYTTDDLASNSLTFEVGRSYAISRASNGSVSFTGTIATNDVTKTVAQGEWNAIGNPYTAYFPINDVSGDNFIANNSSKFDPSFMAVYTWDIAQNKYVATSLVDAESKLAPGQGFFIRTKSGETEVTFSQSQRGIDISSGSSMRFVNTKESSKIELNVSANGNKVTTKILFTDTATKGLDAGYDIGNFEGANLDVFTQLADESTTTNFTVQSLPISEFGDVVIPVGLVAEKNTEVEFSILTTELPSDTNIYLEDKLNSTFVELGDDTYKIKVEDTENTTGRFYLHTSAKVLNTEDENLVSDKVNIFKSSTKEITITGISSTTAVRIYSILGKEVVNTKIDPTTSSKINLNDVTPGVYIVKLQSETSNSSKKIIIE